MGDLHRLPVLIRDEAGLNQEAVDQSEYQTKHNNSGSQHICGVKNHFTLVTSHFYHHSTLVWSPLLQSCVCLPPEMKNHMFQDPPLFRRDSSSFAYSWDFRFLSFTSSTLFPKFRRGRRFSIMTFCLLICLHNLLPQQYTCQDVETGVFSQIQKLSELFNTRNQTQFTLDTKLT